MDVVGSIGTKIKVHVSFAEADLPFVEKLLAVLDGLFELSITPDHPDDAKRAVDLIAAADAVVFVLSPATSDAPAVAQDAKLAQEMSKRILTVLSQPTNGIGLPAPLLNLQPIGMNIRQTFKDKAKQLAELLVKDREWIRQHTVLYARARQWRAAGFDPELLLSGSEVRTAKMWTFERPEDAPKPTDLHIDYIRTSEAPELSQQFNPVDTADDVDDPESKPSPIRNQQLLDRKQPTASRFATLLWPWSRRTPAFERREPADSEYKPEPMAKAEKLSALGTLSTAEPVPEEVQDNATERPEPLSEPDNWLVDLPAVVPAVVARTRSVEGQTVRGLALNQLVRAQTGVRIKKLPMEHLQPYYELGKPAAKPHTINPNAPISVSSCQKDEAELVCAEEQAKPKPGTCPWAPRATAQPPAPRPEHYSVKPQPPAQPEASVPAARSKSAREPDPSPCAPERCSAEMASDRPCMSRPVVDPLSSRPSARLVPKPSPLISKPRATPAHANSTSVRSAPVELVPSERVDEPSDAVRPSSTTAAKPPLVRPAVDADEKLDSLLASFFASEDDALRF